MSPPEPPKMGSRVSRLQRWGRGTGAPSDPLHCVCLRLPQPGSRLGATSGCLSPAGSAATHIPCHQLQTRAGRVQGPTLLPAPGPHSMTQRLWGFVGGTGHGGQLGHSGTSLLLPVSCRRLLGSAGRARQHPWPARGEDQEGSVGGDELRVVAGGPGLGASPEQTHHCCHSPTEMKLGAQLPRSVV